MLLLCILRQYWPHHLSIEHWMFKKKLTHTFMKWKHIFTNIFKVYQLIELILRSLSCLLNSLSTHLREIDLPLCWHLSYLHVFPAYWGQKTASSCWASKFLRGWAGCSLRQLRILSGCAGSWPHSPYHIHCPSPREFPT